MYEREKCIGVLTCVPFYSERWCINEKDGKADLVGGVEESPGTFILEFSEEELDRFVGSAKVCPVNVIYIFDTETGKQLV